MTRQTVHVNACAGGRVADSRPPPQPQPAQLQGRRHALQLSAAAALAAAGLRWAPSAAAEPGANPVTGTREPLTLAEPTQTEGVRWLIAGASSAKPRHGL